MFVVCLVYSKNTKDDEKPWIMVLNKDRGWELPGGQITENEDFDSCLESLRGRGCLVPQ